MVKNPRSYSGPKEDYPDLPDFGNLPPEAREAWDEYQKWLDEYMKDYERALREALEAPLAKKVRKKGRKKGPKKGGKGHA